MLVVLPFLLLLPDIIISTFNRVFYPSPADVLMRHYKSGASVEAISPQLVAVKGVSDK